MALYFLCKMLGEEMKIAITGSRTITDPTPIHNALNNYLYWYPNMTLLCGMARGADMIAYNWAKEKNVPIVELHADWKSLGKRAGYVRNILMIDLADRVLAFWDGKSKGTKHAIDYALEQKKLWKFEAINI